MQHKILVDPKLMQQVQDVEISNMGRPFTVKAYTYAQSAQPQPVQQEPVAIVKIIGYGKDYRPCQHETGEWRDEDGVCVEFADGNRDCIYVSDLLYAPPQAEQPLSDEQIEEIENECYYQVEHGVQLDTKLFAKRVLATQLSTEPAAWRTFDGEGGYCYRPYYENEDYLERWNNLNPRHLGWVELLYTKS